MVSPNKLVFINYCGRHEGQGNGDEHRGHAELRQISHLICPFSTPRVLLSDNGTEFRNQVLEEICKQFGIMQCFTVSYHPASNGLVERANRNILHVQRPVVSELKHTWEDWLAYVAASINSRVCESTGQSPHYIIFGVEKRLPFDLLSSSHSRVFNVDNYAKKISRSFLRHS